MMGSQAGLLLLAFTTGVGLLGPPPTLIVEKLPVLQSEDNHYALGVDKLALRLGNEIDKADELVPERRTYHLCTTRKPALPNCDDSNGLVIEYTCAGLEYEKFGHNLKNLLNKSQSIYWGQRRFPLPANTSVLFMGNSHMAQVTHELICQYAPVIEKFNAPDTGLYGYYSIVEFSNGAKIFHASNSPVVYSRTWRTSHLTTLFGQDISEFSLFVLGSFHHYRPSVVNTTFGTAMLNHSADYTNDIDFLTANPPTLADVLKCYPGPVIAMSMFASYEDAKPQEYREVLSRLANRSNVRIVDGRRYMKELGECGNRNRRKSQSKPGSCDNSKPNHMHRCTGHSGGHPDLIAWDVIETINELLAS